MKHCFKTVVTFFMLSAANMLIAGEILVNFGGGKQQSTSQTNKTYGIDYNFYTYKRSYRQYFKWGVSITHMTTNTATNDSVTAYSIYPQLTLFGKQKSWGKPFFYVRFLGPSYISGNALGERKQDKNFAFQAGVGLGANIKFSDKGKKGIVMLGFKHFSNSELFSNNEGWDFPLVLSLGVRFK